MNNSKLGIFMYSDKTKELCEYIDEYVGKIVICFSYNGMMLLSSLNKSTIINGRPITVTNDINCFINNCNEMIILPFEDQVEIQNIYDDIQEIKKNGIVIKNQNALFEKSNIDFRNDKCRIKDLALGPIVVAFGQDYKESREFCLMIKLRNALVSRGYKVICVSCDDFQANFNVNIIPQDIVCGINPQEIKTYFENISSNREIDILLCEIPDSFVDDQISVRNYCILKSINPDVFILNIMYNDYTGEVLDNISDIVLHRYGIQVDLFNISNVLKYAVTNESYLPITLDNSCFKCLNPFHFDKYKQRVMNFNNVQEIIFEKLKICIGKKRCSIVSIKLKKQSVVDNFKWEDAPPKKVL